MSRSGRPFALLLAALSVACGKIDPGEEPADLDGLDAPDAESHCGDPAVSGAARVRVQRTRDISGNVEEAIVWVDAEGNVVGRSIDENDDGSVDFLSVTFLEYGVTGDWTLSSEDIGADGTPDYVLGRDFDEDGRLVQERTDSNGDGTTDVTFTYAYDDSGREISMEADWNGDGTSDSLSATSYDDLGGSLTTYDEDLDGAPDRIITRGWLEERVWLEQADLGADGTIEEEIRTTYDEEGRVVEVDNHRSLSEEPTDNSTRYEYSATGELILESYDADGDGEAEWEKAYTYEDTGDEEVQTTMRYFGGTLVEVCTLTTHDRGQSLLACDSGPDEIEDVVITEVVCP